MILGVSGVGLLSQFINFSNFLGYVLPLGFPLGIIKFVSEYESEKNDKVNNIVSDSLRLLVIVDFALIITAIIFSGILSKLLLNTPSYTVLIIILVLSSPFSVIVAVLDAYIKGLKQVNLLVKITVTGPVAGLIISVPLIVYFGFEGAFAGFVITNVLSGLLYIFFLWRKKIFPAISFRRFQDIPALKSIFKIGIASLFAGGAQQATFLVIRTITIDNFGLNGNGLFQSVLSLSVNYFGFLFISFASYTFPKIASLKENNELIREINMNFRLVLLITVPLLTAVLSFKTLVISVFYSTDFLLAKNLFAYQFSGEFFKALSWIFGLWLLPRMKIKLFILLELIYYVNFIVIYYILINFFSRSLEYVSLSYLITNIVHAILNFIFIRKHLKFKLITENNILLLLSIVFIVLISIISNYTETTGQIIFAVILPMWLLFSLKKTEKLKIKEIIEKYTKRR